MSKDTCARKSRLNLQDYEIEIIMTEKATVYSRDIWTNFHIDVRKIECSAYTLFGFFLWIHGTK